MGVRVCGISKNLHNNYRICTEMDVRVTEHIVWAYCVCVCVCVCAVFICVKLNGESLFTASGSAVRPEPIRDELSE